MSVKYGCYVLSDGSKVFRRKCDIPVNLLPQVKLWYHDDKYSKYDWTVEPEEDIHELYKQRAIQIRKEYDYLILNYSGGADSHNVLRTFIDNGIKLDEIDMTYSYGFDRRLGILKEYETAGLPRLKWLTAKYPEIKIRLIDNTDFIANTFTSENWVEDNKEIVLANHTFYHAFRDTYIREEQNDYVEKLNRKVGIIYALDKPSFTLHENRLKFLFCDASKILSIFSLHELLYDPIIFYHDPSAAKIPIKQGHLFKKFIRDNPRFKPLAIRKNYSKYLIESKLIESILYPKTYEEVWQLEDKFKDDLIIYKTFGDKYKDYVNEIWYNIKHRKQEENRYFIISKFYDLGEV